MSSGGNSIADIYRSVINDVIQQVKESFLDENIDVDILAQLKKEWEDKVNSSGSVDLDATAAPPPQPPQRQAQNVVGPPPMRNAPPMRVSMPQQQQQQQQQQHQQQQQQMRIPQQQLMHNSMQDPHSIRSQYTIQPGHQNMANMGNIRNIGNMGNIGIPQGMPQNLQPIRSFPANQQFILSNGQTLQPGQIVMMANPMVPGETATMIVNNNGSLQPANLAQSQGQLSHMNQMDGNGGIDEHDEQGSSSSAGKKKQRRKKTKVFKVQGTGASEEEAMKVLGALMNQIQMDGGGGMSDSSSDEEVEEDDDPLRRIADRIGDGGVEDGDQIAEEEPLNSEDDQSDDEDLTMLFDSDNIVMCQFEKVNRARTKWKFQLKDGIMHIDKKDYCFQKCSGEAEW